MHSSKVWPAAAVVLGLTVSACASGSSSPSVPRVGTGPTTTASQAGASSSDAPTALERAESYAECMRSHGVANFPDPVLTPSGGYGFRTRGIDPQSSAFRSSSRTCNALVPGGWQAPGQQLTPAQQQQWLDWAKCIRDHGAPDFADPTFSGTEVHITGGGAGVPPAVQSAMDACKGRMPSAGGLGG
jgi:hypothetical protein